MSASFDDYLRANNGLATTFGGRHDGSGTAVDQARVSGVDESDWADDLSGIQPSGGGGFNFADLDSGDEDRPVDFTGNVKALDDFYEPVGLGQKKTLTNQVVVPDILAKQSPIEAMATGNLRPQVVAPEILKQPQIKMPAQMRPQVAAPVLEETQWDGPKAKTVDSAAFTQPQGSVAWDDGNGKTTFIQNDPNDTRNFGSTPSSQSAEDIPTTEGDPLGLADLDLPEKSRAVVIGAYEKAQEELAKRKGDLAMIDNGLEEIKASRVKLQQEINTSSRNEAERRNAQRFLDERRNPSGGYNTVSPQRARDIQKGLIRSDEDLTDPYAVESRLKEMDAHDEKLRGELARLEANEKELMITRETIMNLPEIDPISAKKSQLAIELEGLDVAKKKKTKAEEKGRRDTFEDYMDTGADIQEKKDKGKQKEVDAWLKLKGGVEKAKEKQQDESERNLYRRAQLLRTQISRTGEPNKAAKKAELADVERQLNAIYSGEPIEQKPVSGQDVVATGNEAELLKDPVEFESSAQRLVELARSKGISMTIEQARQKLSAGR